MAKDVKTEELEPATKRPVSQRSLDNLVKWKPGQSGNPLGRPKNPITCAYVKVLGSEVPDKELVGPLEKFKGTGLNYMELLAITQVMIATDPSGRGGKAAAIAAAKELTNRVEGKVPTVSHSQSVNVNIELSDTERQARIKQIFAQSDNNVIDAEFEELT